jgi:hypothetical protein
LSGFFLCCGREPAAWLLPSERVTEVVTPSESGRERASAARVLVAVAVAVSDGFGRSVWFRSRRRFR